MAQLFPEELVQKDHNTIFDSSAEARKVNDNVTTMSEVANKSVFDSTLHGDQ